MLRLYPLFHLPNFFHECRNFILIRAIILLQTLTVEFSVVQPVERRVLVIPRQKHQRIHSLLTFHLFSIEEREIILIMHCCLLIVLHDVSKEFAKLIQSDTFAISVLMGSFIALDCLLHLVQTLVALSHSTPHARIVGPQRRGLPKIMERIKVHLQNLIRLPEPIPRAIISGINVECSPVSFDSSSSVAHLHELVAHEGPCREVRVIQLQRPLEVQHRFFVLRLERVIVANNAAGFGAILFILKGIMSHERELRLLLFDVENVGVCVHVVESVRIMLQNTFEGQLCLSKVAHIVTRQRHLRHNVLRLWEGVLEFRVQDQCLFIGLQFQVHVRCKKSLDPVIRQLQLCCLLR
mmetsp:Transcript_55543/g.89966  ORF Transcript_55543/g.89966 Transcript_55543/m.89966 type:complete len:351 (-) Transcript_55543:270-1322(-)